jgi:methyl coenzyme M reductase subunit C
MEILFMSRQKMSSAKSRSPDIIPSSFLYLNNSAGEVDNADVMDTGGNIMYWEKEIETIDRKKLEVVQLERLRETVKRAKASLYYDA